ncbi:hypothetical protein IDH41_28020 [Paenibacillus sp. IB182493]|uniref:Uncharacterized protein n=1 Tax=Paenibacillus arenilitoris TaxID=2772299 RepID=A0A927H9A6_9BACL|nr:hypothetical protein [Paenibacillus arenilitoris]
MGVAVSTVICRLLATIVLFIMYLGSFERAIGLGDLKLFNRKLFGEILRIGWSLGVNMSCWVFTQLLIFTWIAMIGTGELAARTYMNTLESFCFLLGYSVALAVQIQIAHLFGAGRAKEAYGTAYRAMWIGLAVVTVNALLIFAFGRQLLGLFADNADIVSLDVSLLGLNLLLQPGKMVNMALSNALNAVGDTWFTMWISVFSMWLIATGLAYYADIELDWGLVDIYHLSREDSLFNEVSGR